MITPTPLAVLIETRMKQLGIERAALGLRLGYRNPAKAAGRVYALCDGHITSTKSKTALERLPEAIELSAEVVETAVNATLSFLADLKRQEDEKLRIARENEDAAWRATFKPHAIIQGERSIPTSITMYAITGGSERWLKIKLDLSKPSNTFIEQVLTALPNRLDLGKDGLLSVPFFGYALGFIINYSPDAAVRYDLKGNAVENLSKAIRPGQAWVSLKGGNQQIADIGRRFEVVKIPAT
jgi:hypothetical protein